MKIIKLLQESSSLSLADLKKAMLKDSSSSLIFNKNLTVDQIDDKESFLSSIRFFILNNDNVKQFISDKNIDASGLALYKGLRANQLDDEKLKWLQTFIKKLFKEQQTPSTIVTIPAKKQIKYPFGKTVKHRSSNDEVITAIENTITFAGKFVLPQNISALSAQVESACQILSDIPVFKQLILNGSTTLGLHLFDVSVKFFKENLQDIKKADLASSKFQDEKLKLTAKAVKSLIDAFNVSQGNKLVCNYNSEEYRSSFNDATLKSLEKSLLVDGRIRSEESANAIICGLTALGLETISAQKLLNMSTDKQQIVVDTLLNKFFKELNLEKSSSTTENSKTFIMLVKKAYRTKMLFIKLNEIKSALDNL